MDIAWIQLGRIGDILNILPLVKEYSRENRIFFYVAEEFAGILEPIDYVQRVSLKIHYKELAKAINLARGKSKLFISQVDQNPRRAGLRNFTLDSWGLVNRKLVAKYQELKLEAKVTVKPINSYKVIYNGFSYSSPFPYHREMSKFLAKWNFLDLTGMKMASFWDLLGYYFGAKLLITVDTATLHLANFKDLNLKVIALQRGGWYSSEPRDFWLKSYRYDSINWKELEGIINQVTSEM